MTLDEIRLALLASGSFTAGVMSSGDIAERIDAIASGFLMAWNKPETPQTQKGDNPFKPGDRVVVVKGGIRPVIPVGSEHVVDSTDDGLVYVKDLFVGLHHSCFTLAEPALPEVTEINLGHEGLMVIGAVNGERRWGLYNSDGYNSLSREGSLRIDAAIRAGQMSMKERK